MTNTNPQGTFSIEYEYRDDDSPLELYRVEYWTVRSVQLDRDIAIYSNTEIQRADSHQYGEVSGVSFAEDGLAILVRRRDGRHERVPLPIAFRLSDDETELIHVHADGTERREDLLGKGLAGQIAAKRTWRAFKGVADDAGLEELLKQSAHDELQKLRARLGR